MSTKTCRDCGQTKSVDEFTRHSKSKDGLYTYCKPCAHKRVRASVEKRLRGELPSVHVDRKTCGRCGVEKPRAAFNVSRARRDGLTTRCIQCEATNRLLRKYGLTRQAYDDLAAAQGHRCLICGTEARLVVDHCHVSGRVRALLCGPCNSGLGYFYDDPQRLSAAAAYVVRATSE